MRSPVLPFSSSLLFFPQICVPSDLCMKYLLCLVIYKKFLYPLGVQRLCSNGFSSSLRIMQPHDTDCKFGTPNFGVPF